MSKKIAVTLPTLSIALLTIVFASCSIDDASKHDTSLSETTGTGVLWNAEIGQCETITTTQGPRLTNCRTSVSRNYPTSITETADAAIMELAFLRYVRLTFNCSALDISIPKASWKIGTASGTLSPGENASVQGDYNMEYSDQGPVISFTPLASTVFKPGCSLNLAANFSYPNPAIAKFYARLLKENLLALDQALIAVSPNAETTAVLSAMDNGIETINEALADYGSDLDPDTKSDLENAITELQAARTTVANTCSTLSADCTTSKQSARDLIAREVTTGQTKIENLRSFLSKEITRLESINAAIASRLNSALNVIGS